MKTLLQCRLERLKEQDGCPLCSAPLQESYFDKKFFPDEEGDDGYQANMDDKAAFRFECGSEFSIDEDDQVISRIPCTMANVTAASLIESDGDGYYEDQEDAA
ncbi:hypothetical protein ACIQUB_07140 [Rhizobium sp. NPDC090275]|uniref:hypothetical protein n=1 Tax=Rhizobium sp. NPDC090275 TaxID=3364498 RepID=UPI00383B24D0